MDAAGQAPGLAIELEITGQGRPRSESSVLSCRPGSNCTAAAAPGGRGSVDSSDSACSGLGRRGRLLRLASSYGYSFDLDPVFDCCCLNDLKKSLAADRWDPPVVRCCRFRCLFTLGLRCFVVASCFVVVNDGGSPGLAPFYLVSAASPHFLSADCQSPDPDP